MVELVLSKARVVKLTDGNIGRVKDFDCGDKDLNEFLKEDAVGHTQAKISTTYLFLYKKVPIGFFCWGMFAIKPGRDAVKKLEERGKRYGLFPAILIARFGVDKRYRGHHVGTEMIGVILGLARKISKKIECRFVVVHSYPHVVEFYRKNGFKELKRRGKNVEMYLDLLGEF
ncbi:MAG: GNAT family N-acetyltransferase [Candidatus Altiarchaeota archaeon]